MIDFSKIKTYPIKNRENKVGIKDFARMCAPPRGLLDIVPNILAGKDLRDLVQRMAHAVKQEKPIIIMMGAHVIKCGLNPLLIELMKRGILSHLALNGAGSVHDFEIALIGETSEDVAHYIEDGSFGMADETGRMLNAAVARDKEKGYGYAVGTYINDNDLPHKEYSLLAMARRYNVPATVHVAIGTDIIHQHPSCDGAAIGKASYEDFKIFADSVSRLGEGGVILNVGSTVLLPEVFLKALTVTRNLGFEVKNFTAANFDMIQHYRPITNVVRRPLLAGGKGFDFRGHHEIMIPYVIYSLFEAL